MRGGRGVGPGGMPDPFRGARHGAADRARERYHFLTTPIRSPQYVDGAATALRDGHGGRDLTYPFIRIY